MISLEANYYAQLPLIAGDLNWELEKVDNEK